MKILVDIQHPAHFHFFKNFIKAMENKNNQIKITAKEKEITLTLLDYFGFDYDRTGKTRSNLFTKALGMVEIDLKLLKVVKNFKPEILLGIHNESVAQVGFVTNRPSVIFTDTEIVGLGDLVTFPFATVICTPTCFRKNLGRKHIRYNGYHELAYLHPRYFTPDLEVLEMLNLSKNDSIIILRFISWRAAHDIGLRGIKRGQEVNFIRSLERYGQVFITSEGKLGRELEKYRLNIPPHKIHSLLYYASLYIGEGGTMAAEAAILGTPAIHIESTSNGVATGELTGNFRELRDKYGLLYFYPDQNQALEKAIEILENDRSKREWQKKRKKLLKDKIDVTAWIVDFIERYPESFYEYKEKNS